MPLAEILLVLAVASSMSSPPVVYPYAAPQVPYREFVPGFEKPGDMSCPQMFRMETVSASLMRGGYRSVSLERKVLFAPKAVYRISTTSLWQAPDGRQAVVLHEGGGLCVQQVFAAPVQVSGNAGVVSALPPPTQ